LQLELTGPGTNYYLIFKTPEEKESWKKDIIEAQERHTRVRLPFPSVLSRKKLIL